MNNILKNICTSSSKELLDNQSYKFIDRGSNILGVAHCDVVNGVEADLDLFFENDKYIFSPGCDDRIGVYIITHLLQYLYPDINYDILLTDGEEIGQSTAKEWAKTNTKTYNWVFSFDRRGNDAVIYMYRMKHWKSAIDKYFKFGYGSFSDISTLESLKTCCVNIGCGYYNNHSISSYTIKEEMYAQIDAFANFYKEYKDRRFTYKKEKPKVYPVSDFKGKTYTTKDVIADRDKMDNEQYNEQYELYYSDYLKEERNYYKKLSKKEKATYDNYWKKSRLLDI